MADDRLRRWRLVLGGDAADGVALEGDDARRDQVLEALYGAAGSRPSRRPGPRDAGLGGSAPGVARWLADIRTYFPRSVVQVMQRDAIDRLGLDQLLLEPELLDEITPDVHLVATLLALGRALPDRARESARLLVRQVTEELRRRMADRLARAVTGALDRSARTRRPRRAADVDWDRTVRANLARYQPELGTVVPERLVGYARRRRAVERDVVIAIDSSASMAESVVYAGVYGCVLAGVPALSTQLITFDTAVADLSAHLDDPVEVLFGVQLGGGTDIEQAVAYCQRLVSRPRDTVLVLITDLFEGGNRPALLRRLRDLTASGVTVVVLLALADTGAPAHDHALAGQVAALGIPAFACTPDAFPEMMAAAIEGRDPTPR